MNLLSHGKLSAGSIARLAASFAALLLFVLFSSASFASTNGGRVSGVVVPKISQIKGFVASVNPTIEEFKLPTKYSSPFGLAIDSSDRIWITQMAGNSLALFDPSTGELKEYRVPSTVGLTDGLDWKYDPQNRTTPEDTVVNYSVGNPGNVIVARDGMIWFVMQLGNSIVRFDPSKEEFTEIMVPTANSIPYDLTEDPKGRIWFIEQNASKFGYLDPKEERIFEMSLGVGANPMGITSDADGNIWLGDVVGNYIGRYNPETKKLKKFPINVHNAQPGVMRFDKDGKLWFCQLRTKQIGLFMPDPGIFSVADIPGFNAVSQSIMPADDGKIWFVDSMMNRVGFFDPNELEWSIFDIPTMHAQPMDIKIDSKGDVWFTQSDRNANRIARVVRSTVKELSETVSEESIAKESAKAGGSSIAGVVAVIVIAFGLLVFIVSRSKIKDS